MSWVVAVYELDRVYGGPEEGGWWYNTGDLKKVLAVRHSEDAAYALARRLNGWLDKLQKNCRSIYSMAYSGGRLNVEVYKDIPPKFYPEQRPYYE